MTTMTWRCSFDNFLHRLPSGCKIQSSINLQEGYTSSVWLMCTTRPLLWTIYLPQFSNSSCPDNHPLIFVYFIIFICVRSAYWSISHNHRFVPFRNQNKRNWAQEDFFDTVGQLMLGLVDTRRVLLKIIAEQDRRKRNPSSWRKHGRNEHKPGTWKVKYSTRRRLLLIP